MNSRFTINTDLKVFELKGAFTKMTLIISFIHRVCKKASQTQPRFRVTFYRVCTV